MELEIGIYSQAVLIIVYIMTRDLTTSQKDRKSILGNNDAIKEVYDNLGFSGVLFEGRYRFTKQQVSQFYEVETRTIDRLLENDKAELDENGYELFRGQKLKDLRDAFVAHLKNKDVYDINVVDIPQSIDRELISLKTPTIGIFTFKSVLNIGMLLTNSERAREVRSAILNIVIDVLNKKIGGSTKYINQREEEFLPSAIREFNYRKEFTNALDQYIVENKFKYAQLTDKIYMSIFKENAKEYRQILSLNSQESVRATMYSEVLDLISSYENGFADFLKKKYIEGENKPLRLSDAHLLFKQFEDNTESVYAPLKEKARGLMATRDMAFRDALHEKLKEYIDTVSLDDIDRFLGEKSKALHERLEENKEVFKRLKDR
ncbi:MAG: hypothetical protein NVS9B7_00700 [Flavisolibacter sp.]